MPNRLTIPGLKVPKLSGWPLVLLLGIGLAAIALVYGSATGNLGDACTMTVQPAQVTVKAGPGADTATVETLPGGTEVVAERTLDSGWRKLDGNSRWVPQDAVAATPGSRC